MVEVDRGQAILILRQQLSELAKARHFNEI